MHNLSKVCMFDFYLGQPRITVELILRSYIRMAAGFLQSGEVMNESSTTSKKMAKITR